MFTFTMSPRILILLGLALAGTGFGGMQLLVSHKNLPGNEMLQPLEAGKANPANCESCKNTPSNRFSMLAKQESKPGEMPRSLSEMGKMEGDRSATLMEKRWAVRTMLANASVAQLEEVFADAQNKLVDYDDPDLQFAVRRLAELDPEKAANLWVKNSSAKMRPDLFLSDWAKKDPAAFLSWNLTQSTDVQKASTYVFASALKDAPEKLVEISSQLVISASGPAAVRGVVEAMSIRDKASPEKALALAQSLPEGPLRNAALVALLKWPEAKAAERPEVLLALTQVEPEEAKRLGRDLGKFAAELPAGAVRESAFISALQEQAEKDPSAAAKRLDGLAGTPDYAAAVRGFVEKTAGKDPAAAAEWALTIGEAAQMHRISALERVAASWFKSSPDDARAWVEKAPLTDSEYFKLTGRPRGR